MKQYLELMADILDNGAQKGDRTGTGTLSVFGRQMRFNLADGFPLVTTKKTHMKSITYELLWMMKGLSDVKWLQDRGINIWNEWQNADGTIGPGYGHQWRSWAAPNFVPGYAAGHEWESSHWEVNPVDQLQNVLDRLVTHPDCRRHIVSAWNAGQIDEMALPPCHLLFQFYVVDNKLSCQLYQRSCDFFLGVPFNIASYAMLIMMMAQMANLELGEFIWTGGDVHLYNNHLDQARLQLSRQPRELPRLQLRDRGQGLNDWEFEDISLFDYDPHPGIKAQVSV